MILLDTNVLIYADDRNSLFHPWARQIIVKSAAVEEAAVNPVVVAEICVGETHPEAIPTRIQKWGVLFLDLPVAASPICARAYNLYRDRRMVDSGKPLPDTPLPDFFFGAHAMVMGWSLATADPGRFRTYFPDVPLLLPE